jgi:hypothetical protein
VHFRLCAGMQGQSCQSGDLIFSTSKSLHSPLLLLSGRATLLLNSGGGVQPCIDDCMPPEVEPGHCLSFASVTWLDPRTVAAAACGPLQLLRLPAQAYGEHAKLSHLRVLSRRAATLGSLPLLHGCDAPVLRALAHAAVSAQHRPGATLAREGSECKGLIVLTKGSARVCMTLNARGGVATSRNDHIPGCGEGCAGLATRMGTEGGTSDARDPLEGVERTIAQISAPEMIGVIDLIDALLAGVRKAPVELSSGCTHVGPANLTVEVRTLGPRQHEQPASGAALAASDAGPQGGATTAAHGATVRATSAGESMLLPTGAIVRHVGAVILSRLANVAFDRKLVRRALREEIQSQLEREAQEEKLRAQMYMEMDEPASIVLGGRAEAIAAAALRRPPPRPQRAPDSENAPRAAHFPSRRRHVASALPCR